MASLRIFPRSLLFALSVVAVTCSPIGFGERNSLRVPWTSLLSVKMSQSVNKLVSLKPGGSPKGETWVSVSSASTSDWKATVVEGNQGQVR